MKLLRVDIQGYGRFYEKQSFSVDSDVVALVGPNEAGKTSVLDALAHLNHAKPFSSAELSRDSEQGDDVAVVRAVFALDDADRAALGEVPEAGHVQVISYTKSASGRLLLHWHGEPPSRNRSAHQRAVSDLLRAASGPAFRDMLFEDGSAVRTNLESRAEALAAVDETMTEEQLAELRRLAENVKAWMPDDAARYVRDLPDRLLELGELEATEHPRRVTAKLLFARRPTFLKFDSAARGLASSYSIPALESAVPKALENLAQVAKLDLVKLRLKVAEASSAEVQSLLVKANEALEQTFGSAWSQGKISASLAVNGETLQLFVREQSGSVWEITQRSDGLRWFVALVAMVAGAGSPVKPILLVDEAEQHLHYDAQADLVRTFQEQREAAGVLYTTHSAGCLPQDLGAGVKVVKRQADDASAIVNGFWVDNSGLPDTAGFSPVLMGMGASTFAFSAARYALFCEGRTDAILLPTLVREAMGWRSVPFQVLPGLAAIRPVAAMELDLAAARVLFLVDGDASGRAIKKKLKTARVPDHRLLSLAASVDEVITLEDFLCPSVHKETIDAQLSHRGSSKRVPISVLKPLGRDRAFKDWCATQGLDRELVNKAQVAHSLVTIAREGRAIVDPRRRARLRLKVADIQNGFGYEID